jgi:hypothetical protein
MGLGALPLASFAEFDDGSREARQQDRPKQPTGWFLDNVGGFAVWPRCEGPVGGPPTRID